MTCSHEDSWFDRSICADPCGMMHSYCTDCGHMMERCAFQEKAAGFRTKRRIALERAKKLLEYVIKELDSLE